MTTLRKSIYLKADKETVWAYLTQVEKVKTWFHLYDADLEEGQDYKIIGKDSGSELGFGTVTRAQPFDRLEYTFSIEY